VCKEHLDLNGFPSADILGHHLSVLYAAATVSAQDTVLFVVNVVGVIPINFVIMASGCTCVSRVVVRVGAKTTES